MIDPAREKELFQQLRSSAKGWQMIYEDEQAYLVVRLLIRIYLTLEDNLNKLDDRTAITAVAAAGEV